LINRIPVTDISPTVFFGGDFVPVKAIAGEEIPVSATIFREGHDLLGADVVLYNAQGKELSRSVMAEQWRGGDRYQGSVRIPAQGDTHSPSTHMTTHLPHGFTMLKSRFLQISMLNSCAQSAASSLKRS